ncbi:MAG: Chloramphenicol acetyltransferase, partial [Nitrospirota bacterium]
ILIPIAIQVNHALVDGIHLGDFYAHLSSMCHAPGRYVVP